MAQGFVMSSRVARGFHKSRATGGRVGEDSYILHISKMKSLIALILMNRNLSANLGVGLNLVILGTRADITAEETVRTLFLEYAVTNDDVNYIVNNTILLIYTKGSELNDIPAAFARDYKISVWTASQASWFRYEGKHSSFEYVDESFNNESDVDPWTIIDPVGTVYYFPEDVAQCRSAELNGFAGWCDNKIPGQFDLGVELALIKILNA